MTVDPPPPNQVLQFLLDVVDQHFGDPTSELYLPTLIQAQTDPTYEPYLIPDSWHLANEPGLNYAAEQICIAYCPDPDGIGTPTGLPDLWLMGQDTAPFKGAVPFGITGLSNMTIADPTVTTGDTVVGTATIGRIETWPIRPMTVSGNWTLSQGCRTDAGADYTGYGYGTFVATIATATITGQATVDGTTLAVTVDRLDFATEETAANIQVTVELLEITDPAVRDMWTTVVNEVFGDRLTRAAIVGQLAGIIGSQTTRDSFAALATKALQSVFSTYDDRLDGIDVAGLARLRAEAGLSPR